MFALVCEELEDFIPLRLLASDTQNTVYDTSFMSHSVGSVLYLHSRYIRLFLTDVYNDFPIIFTARVIALLLIRTLLSHLHLRTLINS